MAATTVTAAPDLCPAPTSPLCPIYHHCSLQFHARLISPPRLWSPDATPSWSLITTQARAPSQQLCRRFFLLCQPPPASPLAVDRRCPHRALLDLSVQERESTGKKQKRGRRKEVEKERER
ncbi:hypothetical protein M0R45_004992 [Rubus argutus]|uniref:Uncharacterized protein n=1 Tax=Rubus argutus TaxID=59490 RepID=A0AAW1YLY7_RUBAR